MVEEVAAAQGYISIEAHAAALLLEHDVVSEAAGVSGGLGHCFLGLQGAAVGSCPPLQSTQTSCHQVSKQHA